MLDYKYKTILAVAVPLMISSFIQSIVLITDASFLSRFDTLAFDAAGNGGLLYVTMLVSLTGMSDGSQILIARRIGQENENAVGRIFGTSLFTLSFFAILLFILLQTVIPYFLPLYSKHQDLASAQLEYLSVRSYALFFSIITLSIQSFLYAIGKTWVVMISAFLVAISNIGMDYLFIFGWEDWIPEMGLKGAAWASTAADAVGMTFLLCFLLLSKENKKFKLFTYLSIEWKSIKELIKVGSPLFFQGFLALATWTIFFTWIEQIGKFELTVSQNIRAIYFLAFVPIWGFAATTKTYISQYLGRKDYDSISKIQRRIMFLSFSFLFLFCHGAFFYPEKYIQLINPEEEYIAKSAEILRFIAGSIFIFSISSVMFQTINGSGNTRATFYIELLSVFVYIFSSYVIIKVLKTDIYWVWLVEYIYFICLGLFSFLYLRFTNWKYKKI
jgi:MATE family multidrug resistance protein